MKNKNPVKNKQFPFFRDKHESIEVTGSLKIFFCNSLNVDGSLEF